MDISNKLETLANSAKYDVACTSSGAQGNSNGSGIGNTTLGGVCHSFAADGRCITLLKVLMTNICINDCKYCVNRKSNMEIKREAFTPRELADLTIEFYRRNYIEGLFLSSGIIKSPDYTCELMLETISILRNEYDFYGYIHAKAIPGADNLLIEKIGRLADRISVNIEMPSQNSLSLLAPDKSKDLILKPMGYIKQAIEENAYLPAIRRSSSNIPTIIDSQIARLNKQKPFAPAGQSTQMIIGASPESDCHILKLTENLYQRYKLKRVFFSAYIPVSNDSNLPALDTKPPLLREHRLYQADWLMRFYRFKADEILDEKTPNFNPFIDPKCNWALNHKEFFPVEINKASYANLLRVPGIGVLSAQKIMKSRRFHSLDFYNLKKLGVVLKRAQYFILCNGKPAPNFQIKQDMILNDMMSKRELTIYKEAFTPKQIELFSHQELLAG
ncbi:MAG: putative DNA modification/repair radical SAM protein [Endomicrobium sp.]|jgi:putative DNA modification/repair radical SAM protein|nr:putative DNA modification/repair radical SAM protein [Endomicrobium sp.]